MLKYSLFRLLVLFIFIDKNDRNVVRIIILRLSCSTSNALNTERWSEREKEREQNERLKYNT